MDATEVLSQIESTVDRFCDANPRLRNDRDDLVQEAALIVLSRVDEDKYLARQCRAFIGRAAIWTCLRQLKRETCEKNRKTVRFTHLAAANFQENGKKSEKYGDSALQYIEGPIAPTYVDWKRVDRFLCQNADMLDWLDREQSRKVRSTLREQLLSRMRQFFDE